MKILVGIMYCIEQEYPECVRSLQDQSYTNHDFFRIEKLPNKLAHDALYACFMDNADKYDLFLKLDADMVLCREDFLDRVVAVFQRQPDIDDLQIGVHDFFTDRLIYGLHVYSNRVKWIQNQERVFVDMVDRRKKRVQDMKVLAPAAWHCPNPSRFQAFHFGVHKAVKVLQIGALQVNENNRKVHSSNISRMFEIWHARKNIRHGFAVLGAFRGLVEKLDYRAVDFESEVLKTIYSEYENMSLEQVADAVESLYATMRSGAERPVQQVPV